ncbi:GyrI-like domain-containing protein [Pseudonocardia sichuanensis]
MENDTRTCTPELLDLPARDVLTVDGTGAPEMPAFTAAVRALFAVRAALGSRDDVPLEGSYSQDGDPLRFDLDAPDGWHWRLLVPAPPHATPEAVATAAARFGAPVHLRRPQGQRVARLLHRGPYADEGPTLAALYAFVERAGLVPAGPHTEVYLTDPSATPPAQLRTHLQVPVSRWV